MNVKEKADQACNWIEVIAGHDDEELTVREAALKHIRDKIDSSIAAAEARNDIRIAKLFGGVEVAPEKSK
jgi:hypothetical protein